MIGFNFIFFGLSIFLLQKEKPLLHLTLGLTVGRGVVVAKDEIKYK